MRQNTKFQVNMSINSLLTSHLKLTCQSIFFNMEKISVIRFFVWRTKKAKEIYEEQVHYIVNEYQSLTEARVTSCFT